MKHLISLLSVFLTALLVLGMSTTAFAAENEIVPSGICLESADGVTTAITFDSGAMRTLSGSIDLSATEKNPVIGSIETIEVRYEDTPVLTVEPRDIAASGVSQQQPNGYYAITFAIPDTTKECFLTGLKPEKVELVQSMLLESFITGEDFSIEDIDFIDAEKRAEGGDGDDNLCWAGTASNMIHYSGWGKKAGFETEDDVFEAFIGSFNDEGYTADAGVRWFFRGGDTHAYSPESGGYLRDYDAASCVGSGSFFYYDSDAGVTVTGMDQMLSLLKEGYAMGLSLTWKDADFGHAITLWGCVTDNAYDESLLAHYESLIVSDSDSNEPFGADRRTAPNTLELYHVTLSRADDDDESYPTAVIYGETGMLDGYQMLRPYSDSIPYETDERATRDYLNDPDYYVSGVFVSPYNGIGIRKSTHVFEGDVYLWARILNGGYESYEDIQIKLDASVKDENGDVVWSCSDDYTYNRDMGNLLITKLSNVKQGVYTVDITVNSDAGLREALLVNNSYTDTFEAVGDRPDVSAYPLTATVGDFADNRVEVQMDYSGIEQTDFFRESTDQSVLMALFNGETWTDYFYAMMNDDGSLPETIDLDNYCTKVRFALAIYQDDLVLIVESGEYDVMFPHIEIVPDDDNPGGAFFVDNDVRELGEGNELSFTLVNDSGDAAPVIKGSIEVRLVHTDGRFDDTHCVLGPVPVTLENGIPSERFTLSSLALEEDIYGVYTVMVIFTGENYENYTVSAYLSTLCTPEKRSTVVDMQDDLVDAYDELTSLREAVAYCEENGGTVTFSENVSQVVLYEPIEVNGSAAISGLTEDESRNVAVSGDESSRLFKVGAGGSLSLSDLSLGGVFCSDGMGGAIYCEGGSVVVDRCLFERCRAQRGGAIAFSGGTGVIRNTGFLSSGAAKGAAVYLENGASVDMLNSSVIQSNAWGNGALYNQSGKLNLINSDVINSYSDTSDAYPDDVFSAGETNIINSAVTEGFYEGNSVAGSCRVFGSALNRADEAAVLDDLTELYPAGRMIVKTWLGNYSVYMLGDENVTLFPEFTSLALNGYVTRVIDGEVYLGKDNDSLRPTGVKTALTDSDVTHDYFGDARDKAFYGPCGDLRRSYPFVLGDADNDGEAGVSDATVIQRCNANIAVPYSEEILSHGDVDFDGELSVLDATLIQRYAAQMKVNYPIGRMMDELF